MIKSIYHLLKMAKISVMKNTLTKIKIHDLTYLMIFTFLITGYIKNILIILSIVIFHELGHVFFLKKYEIEIDSITIYPFGGLTTTSKLINTPLKKDLIIYFGGIFFQIIYYLLFFSLYKLNLFHENTFYLFLNYNTTILIFNLLPIRPLDGGEILNLFLSKFYPYKKANNIANLISFISLFIFFLLNIRFNLNNYLIISYLFFKLYNLFKKQNFIFHKFLLERYLYILPYEKIEHDSKISSNILKRDTLHFFKKGEKYVHEREILAKKFDRNTYF